VHLHLLRHSCASWTFLRLIVSDFKTIPDLFPHLAKTNEWVKNSSKPFRAALYLNENVTNDHGWAISSLLGQSRPDVAVDNYIHLFDRLSPVVLGESGYLDDLFGETVLRDASGLKGAFYYRRKAGKSDEIIIGEVVTSRIQRTRVLPAQAPQRSWAFSLEAICERSSGRV